MKNNKLMVNLVNKYKTMSTKNKILNLTLFLLAIASIILVIVFAIQLNDIHNSYLIGVEEYMNNRESTQFLVNGVDIVPIINKYPDKGPEAISWYLTAGDSTGGGYYIGTIVSGLLMLPTLTYTISFLLINLFPRKTQEEKEKIKLAKQQKKKSKKKGK